MSALYKVFLAEDEIVIREGIRENVDWAGAGFVFCGEAADGEMALPLILAARPDVLITDIKMPFIDGLELARLARASLPQIKIVILSGHDEFQYAQQAIQLGVTEYLLKPVGVRDMAQVLKKVADQLDRERAERAQLQGLQHQLADSVALKREKLLLRLLTDDVAVGETLAQANQLGLDLVARAYQVIFLRAAGPSGDFVGPAVFTELTEIERVIVGLADPNPDVIAVRKDVDEFVLILKGKDPDQIRQDAYFLAETIKERVTQATACHVAIGLSQPCERVGALAAAFAESVRNAGLPAPVAADAIQADLLQLDDAKILEFLKFGDPAGFDAVFEQTIAPLGRNQNRIFLDYILLNVTLVTARHLRASGGDPAQILPNAGRLEDLPGRIRTAADAQAYLRGVMLAALDFRDRQANRQAAGLIERAKRYVETRFSDPELSLTEVARHVSLSAGHFSAIFSRETGQTFKDYLTGLRIERAKELLRATDLGSAEIAERVGYSDPHYFSTVFKKHAALTPREYRGQKR